VENLREHRRKEDYFHPEFYGSFFLKAVLPVLIPCMSCGDLKMQDYDMASLEYLRMLDPATPPEERAKIKCKPACGSFKTVNR